MQLYQWLEQVSKAKQKNVQFQILDTFQNQSKVPHNALWSIPLIY